MVETFDAFRFPVRVDADRGQIQQEPDQKAYVAQLIRQVLLTAPGERVHRPDFGAGLRRQVFAPTDDGSASMVKTTVYEALERWLGAFITVDDVQIQSFNARLDVTVVYTLRAIGEQEVLNLEVTE